MQKRRKVFTKKPTQSILLPDWRDSMNRSPMEILCRPLCVVIIVAALAACASAERSALPAQATAKPACACQPESADTGRENLECFCRNGRCPESFDVAVAELSKAQEHARNVWVIRSEGCGLLAIGNGNGFFSEVFIYDAGSRALVGARFIGDLCTGPCSCSIVAGLGACPTAKNCLLSGPNVSHIPECDAG